MRFSDKVAIITGGSSGMGKATALAFIREGAYVVINDIDETSLNETVEEIRKIDDKVMAAPGDVTKSEIVNLIVDKTLKQYGKVDILFNHVGGNPDYAPMRLFIEEDETYWGKMIKQNLWSTMIFCRAVLNSMIKQKYGKIINTSAAAGKTGSGRMVAYSTVKGGIIAFTKALAQECAAYNINVNCICPGPIETPGFAKIFPEQVGDKMRTPGLLGRVGTPEEVASAVLYLASDDASYITGQPLSIDGGMTMV